MMALRQVFTGIGVGVVVALFVHQLFEHGLDLEKWSFRSAETPRYIVIGAVVGAVSQFVGASRGRR